MSDTERMAPVKIYVPLDRLHELQQYAADHHTRISALAREALLRLIEQPEVLEPAE